MEHIHYIIIIPIIVAITILQFTVYRRAWSAMQLIKDIFSSTKTDIRTVEVYIPADQIGCMNVHVILDNLDAFAKSEDNSDVKVTLIAHRAYSNQNSVLKNVLASINTYLIRNKSAASDFSLIKDIVERNCEVVEEELHTQLPLPLYLGLMGTMIGIIVGIGCVSIGGGGFSAFITTPENSIGLLMGGVAVAMLASLIGIMLTTLGSWHAKGAKTILESDKNAFYTWLQTELLPVVSMNTATSLQLLHQNLMAFNASFSVNVSKMDDSLGKITDSFDNQVKLIGMLENMDIRRMATANVEVLKHLNSSTKEFEKFNSYMFSLNDYLANVKELSNNVNQHLDRTQAIEKMGQFFEMEISAIAQRKSMITTTVVEIDDKLKKAIGGLADNVDVEMGNLRQRLIKQQDDFEKAISAQKEMAIKSLQDAELLLNDRLNQTSAILDELKQLPEVKKGLQQWEQLEEKQSALLADLSRAIGELSRTFRENVQFVPTMEMKHPIADTPIGQLTLPAWCKRVVIILLILLTGILGMQVYSAFSKPALEEFAISKVEEANLNAGSYQLKEALSDSVQSNDSVVSNKKGNE